MAIYVGSAAGGICTLDQLNVERFQLGYMLAAFGTGDVYKLSSSADVADDDDVVAVKDNGNLRWIKQRVDTQTATTKVLPGPSGNIQLGADGDIADDAVAGFPTIPTVGEDFEKGAATIDEGHVAVTFRAVTNQIGVYLPGTGWLWTAELEADVEA